MPKEYLNLVFGSLSTPPPRLVGGVPDPPCGQIGGHLPPKPCTQPPQSSWLPWTLKLTPAFQGTRPPPLQNCLGEARSPEHGNFGPFFGPTDPMGGGCCFVHGLRFYLAVTWLIIAKEEKEGACQSALLLQGLSTLSLTPCLQAGIFNSVFNSSIQCSISIHPVKCFPCFPMFSLSAMDNWFGLLFQVHKRHQSLQQKSLGVGLCYISVIWHIVGVVVIIALILAANWGLLKIFFAINILFMH